MKLQHFPGMRYLIQDDFSLIKKKEERNMVCLPTVKAPKSRK